MNHALFMNRIKKGICTDCESPDNVHYSGRCFNCHRLQQDSKNYCREKSITGFERFCEKGKTGKSVDRSLSSGEQSSLSNLADPNHASHTDVQPYQNTKTKNDEKLLFTILATAFVTILLLWLSGVFDSNKKSQSEIKIDLYSKCIAMNGIDCENMFSKQ